ncbi:hypothetical protein AB0L71_24860 [Streptomyces sp. NPDC052052]|uniref:hypothetical protein n=1 Tax=Streptomyces sp. NPDC052052 TaxID=3154756 RepID=UPI00341D4FE2
MHHPAHTPTGPADLALPLALLAQGSAGPDAGTSRTPEVRTSTSRRRRAARRRAAAVRG